MWIPLPWTRLWPTPNLYKHTSSYGHLSLPPSSVASSLLSSVTLFKRFLVFWLCLNVTSFHCTCLLLLPSLSIPLILSFLPSIFLAASHTVSLPSPSPSFPFPSPSFLPSPSPSSLPSPSPSSLPSLRPITELGVWMFPQMVTSSVVGQGLKTPRGRSTSREMRPLVSPSKCSLSSCPCNWDQVRLHLWCIVWCLVSLPGVVYQYTEGTRTCTHMQAHGQTDAPAHSLTHIHATCREWIYQYCLDCEIDQQASCMIVLLPSIPPTRTSLTSTLKNRLKG